MAAGIKHKPMKPRPPGQELSSTWPKHTRHHGIMLLHGGSKVELLVLSQLQVKAYQLAMPMLQSDVTVSSNTRNALLPSSFLSGKQNIKHTATTSRISM